MTAWVAAFDHPFFAVSAADGAFQIPDLPPGQYTVRAWHERLGHREQRVMVAAGQPAELDIAFAPTQAQAREIYGPAADPLPNTQLAALTAGEPACDACPTWDVLVSTEGCATWQP